MLRQRMNSLEAECGTLADRLLQGQVARLGEARLPLLQVTKAENEEGRLVAEEQLVMVAAREEEGRRRLAEAEEEAERQRGRAERATASLEAEVRGHEVTRRKVETSRAGREGEDEGLGEEDEGLEELAALRELYQQAQQDTRSVCRYFFLFSFFPAN